jgi:hypothetical protein
MALLWCCVPCDTGGEPCCRRCSPGHPRSDRGASHPSARSCPPRPRKLAAARPHHHLELGRRPGRPDRRPARLPSTHRLPLVAPLQPGRHRRPRRPAPLGSAPAAVGVGARPGHCPGRKRPARPAPPARRQPGRRHQPRPRSSASVWSKSTTKKAAVSHDTNSAPLAKGPALSL